MKPIIVWAGFTPKGRIIIASIRQKRKDAIEETNKEFSGWQGPGKNHWKLLQSEGFTIRKIRIEVEK